VHRRKRREETNTLFTIRIRRRTGDVQLERGKKNYYWDVWAAGIGRGLVFNRQSNISDCQS
jgi:hypothetical protein